METRKSDRQINYEGLRAIVIRTGLSEELFPLGEADINSVDPILREIKNQNPELKIMLGDINLYAEKILLCTSKKSLDETHRVFTTETRRYWCQQVGIEPRAETNQGQKAGSCNKKSYGINCLLTVEQAIRMFCFYLRFGVAPELKIPIEEFQDLGIVIFLDFLERGKRETIWALDDAGLGSPRC
ncbi:MAG: hypothetical protein HEQ27_23215 [Dolichospermum sp. JUN01]|jgi:hypothetical protein|nr:hypothetical protein [Dolichospermum sp. JUN01]MBS9391051.1 hypothetical protein [Dolichospermum sp. WA123]